MSTLFHVSDLHFGAEDIAALARFAAAVHAERPHAVLVTGDLTMRARRSEFAAASRWLTALGVPLSIEVGNHDLPWFDPWARFVRPYARYDRLARAIGAVLDLPDAVIVPLRTTARAQLRLNWAQGQVTPRRVDAAVEALQAAGDSRVRIVACHHPLMDRPGGHTEGRTRGGRTALARLSAAGADLVLSGHVHDPFDIVWSDGPRPLRLIGAGTLSERVRATPPSYNRIDIAGHDIQVAPQLLG